MHLLNLEGLVGPTHTYGGLAQGNLASAEHKGQASSPQQAALQGLAKMHFLAQRGSPQAILPPQIRPNLAYLYQLGFRGSDQQMIEKAFRNAPHILEACFSASGMWAANSATVTASSDCAADQVQLTPANLISGLHRSLEARFNHHYLQLLLPSSRFQIHLPLPAQAELSDEGAANHIRLSDPESGDAVNLFVYGSSGQSESPQRYPARQHKQASEALIRRHQLKSERYRLVQQNPEAIDQGIFHNDVIALGLQQLLILHEQAFVDQPAVLSWLRQRTAHWQQPLQIIEISQQTLSLTDAVSSYLFNSQLVPLPGGKLLFVAPQECQENSAAKAVLDTQLSESMLIGEISYQNLRQSMQNGGGPACLRLGIPLTTAELADVYAGARLDGPLYLKLQQWVERHYRDRLHPQDFTDPQLLQEIETAQASLSELLQLPQLYHA